MKWILECGGLTPLWTRKRRPDFALRASAGKQVAALHMMLLMVLGLGLTANAEVSLDEFERIPVLSNGRVMPLDSFAQNALLQFSGRRELGRKPSVPASAWLARTLFRPDEPVAEPLFLINHPDVATALGVEPEKKRRYTFGQLHQGLPKLAELAQKASQMDDKVRSHVEKEILRVYSNVQQYMQLMTSFGFTIPHGEFAVNDAGLRELMGLPEGPVSFLEVVRQVNPLQEVVSGLPEREPSSWSTAEQEAFRLSSAMFAWAREHRNLYFTPVPADPHGDEVWLSGWDALGLNLKDKELSQAIGNLGEMAQAYRADDSVSFDMAARSYRSFVEKRLRDGEQRRDVALEVQFNRLNLFYRAGWCYGPAFGIAFIAFVSGRRRLAYVALGLIGAAVVMHATGIVMRMMIMGRPPVTNLYATFLFVGLVCVLLGLILEAIQRNGLGLVASSFGGLALLMIAQRFFSDGDTMNQVVAVLDSNFWLSTHVVAITTGYAGCMFAGILGHIYLGQAIFSPGRTERLAETYRAMIGMLAFGLTFSFLGTMLGGVWADQSWGRFWGWDPKENGALLIVLWSALLFHARLGRMIGDRGMAGGCVLGVIVVMTAWLGVNLLSVGLHSYGFTSGLAGGFFATIVAEVLFVAVTVPWASRRFATL